jgi:ubiquinol-cytochrome c reductase iron-sulfur subunit
MTDFASPGSRLSRQLTTRGDADRLSPEKRRRAMQQVAGAFGVSAVLVSAVIVFYFGVSVEARGDAVDLGGLQNSNLVLGLTLGFALLLAGVGAVHWSRVLMTSTEIVERRGADDLVVSIQRGSGGGATGTGLGRRRLIRNTLLGALALLPLPAVAALRKLEPGPAHSRGRTGWAAGARLLTDLSYRPIRASDLQVGEMVSVMPASFLDLPDEGPARLNERAKSPVVLVRMQPEELAPADGRENWHVDGIIAYSKICTHVGCPVSLYDRTTHHLLCPCHQATFDLSDNGAVVFGPATRSLPQLPIAIDDDGFLVARSDFTVAVGPSYWEREA